MKSFEQYFIKGLNEQTLPEDALTLALKKEMANILTVTTNEFDFIEPENPEKLGEVAVPLAAGITLALPAILKYVGKAINWGTPKIKKLIGISGETDETKIGNAFINASEWLHENYLKPIKWAVTKMSKKYELNLSGDQIEKVSNLIFHVIIAGFMAYSGFSVIKELGTGSYDLAALESALVAIKRKELSKFLTNGINNMIGGGAAVAGTPFV